MVSPNGSLDPRMTSSQAARGPAKSSVRFPARSKAHRCVVDLPLTASDIAHSNGTGPGTETRVDIRVGSRPTVSSSKENKASIEVKRPHSIGSSPVRSGPRSLPRPGRALVATVLVAVAGVIAACGNDTVAKSGGHVSKKISAVERRDSAVLAGWRASLDAFDTAQRTMNWESPAVAATHVQPELGTAVRNMYLFHTVGYVAIGQNKIEWAKVLTSSEKKATVSACIFAGEVDVYGSTHEPVAGVLGQSGYTEATATMVNTPSGWKLEYQSWIDPCS
jgi:hypothetical protein